MAQAAAAAAAAAAAMAATRLFPKIQPASRCCAAAGSFEGMRSVKSTIAKEWAVAKEWQ
jgi:hypothetical protein